MKRKKKVIHHYDKLNYNPSYKVVKTSCRPIVAGFWVLEYGDSPTLQHCCIKRLLSRLRLAPLRLQAKKFYKLSNESKHYSSH
jgi:hypothetical protein